MDDKLLKVKVVFDKVREMRNEIGTLFEGLDGRITKLTDVYNDFIKNTKQIKTADTKIFIFSLDSFYFQNNDQYSYILVGGVFFRGFCEKSSWIFEFLVVVRATFSVGQRIWV